jgi:hypothetical protein
VAPELSRAVGGAAAAVRGGAVAARGGADDPRRGWRGTSSGVARLGALAVSFVLLGVVGLSGPNAARPDLRPDGWAPGALFPFALSPAAVTAALWVAYALGGLGVLAGLRHGPRGLRTWRWPVALGATALLSAPFGTADHLSYLAYGRILVRGGDPWFEAPAAWAGGTDPVTSRVEPPWTEEPSVYGPFGTLVHGAAAWLGGDSLRQGVWVWQLVVVGCWLAVRALLRTALPSSRHGRIDVCWTLNPIVFGVVVLGAHIDVLATVLALGALVLAARRGPMALGSSGLLVALAASTKPTYGVVLCGPVAAWWLLGVRGREFVARVALLAGVAVVITSAGQLWAGPHVLDQVLRSRGAVSLATVWRPLLEPLGGAIGGSAARTAITVGAAVVALGLAWGLFRVTRPAPGDEPAVGGSGVTSEDRVVALGLWVSGVLVLAYALAAPYSLPWYDTLVWAALPAVAPGVVDVVALVRLVALAAAYVPGRVQGMTPGVENLTLGVRRGVVPWLMLALWATLIARAVRRGRRSGPPCGTSVSVRRP